MNREVFLTKRLAERSKALYEAELEIEQLQDALKTIELLSTDAVMRQVAKDALLARRTPTPPSKDMSHD